NQKNNFYNGLYRHFSAPSNTTPCSIEEILTFTHNSLSLEKDQNNHLVNAMFPLTQNISLHGDYNYSTMPIARINLIVFSSDLKNPNTRFNLAVQLIQTYPTYCQKNR